MLLENKLFFKNLLIMYGGVLVGELDNVFLINLEFVRAPTNLVFVSCETRIRSAKVVILCSYGTNICFLFYYII